jgi:hypothetical protein
MRARILALLLLLAALPAGAAQIARPISDNTPGGWISCCGGTLAAQIDEVSASDADFIQSASSVVDAGRVNLGVLVDPNTSSGHNIRFRARRSAGPANGGWVDLRLYSGASLIGTFTVSQFVLTSSYQTFSFTLTAVQADAITNYADLDFEFVSQPNGFTHQTEVSWAELETPSGGRRVMVTVTQASLPPEGLLLVAIAALLQRRRGGMWRP